MTVERKSLGTTAEGIEIDEYTLAAGAGLRAQVMTYGATLTRVEVPDRDGDRAVVTLYLDSLDDYLAGHPFLGSIAGRYANRIAGGRFTLDGVEYKLATNNGPNHLHGGEVGFDKAVWQAEPFDDDDACGVRLAHVSPDGDEGYPGELSVAVTYTVTRDNELRMEYVAQTDRSTHVNLTNHAYWNLAGAGTGDVLEHVLQVHADRYLPVDDTLIPRGDPAPVEGTPMDFREPTPIGARIAEVGTGYDHCYVLNKGRAGEFALAARVADPRSGRVMEVWTTQPGVQLYTANFFDGSLCVAGLPCHRHYGFCLETQHYPDAPNRPDFPSTVLRPGETYRQVTVHKFGLLG